MDDIRSPRDQDVTRKLVEGHFISIGDLFTWYRHQYSGVPLEQVPHGIKLMVARTVRTAADQGQFLPDIALLLGVSTSDVVKLYDTN